MTPFLTALSVTVAEQTRAHAHKHPHTGELGESKGVFVTATFISFSLMALHTETHLQNGTVRTEQQARLLFFCASTLLWKELISRCPSAVRGWSIHCAWLTLWSGNEGAGRRVRPVGGVAPADGHSLELIRERRKGLQLFEVKSGNGNLAK